MSPALELIAAKVDAGEPLTDVDAQELASTSDIITLGMLADDVRRTRHGNHVTFVRVAHVGIGETPGGTLPAAAGEIRLDIVPDTIEVAVAAVQTMMGRAGETPFSGFSLAELAKMAATTGVSLRSCLEQLKSAGLDHLSEVPLDGELDIERGLAAAAEAGIATPRLVFERADKNWLDRLAGVNRLQEQFPAIRAISPLASRPQSIAPPTGYEDLKRVSIARLCAGRLDTIQVDWSLYGPKLAQVALTFGADDLDNVSAIDDDESLGRRRAALAEVRGNIEAASFVPYQRNGCWELVNR